MKNINNPIRNLLIPPLVYLFVEKFAGYFLYMKAFPSLWLPFVDIWRPMSDPHWSITMPILALFYGFVISFIYLNIAKNGKSTLNIFKYSLVFFIIGRVFGELYNFAMFPYGFGVAIIGMIHGFVTIMLWALICQKIFILKK